ncbi:MAG: GHKL domain-containing protein [Saccharofermentans sp.]|nr:GHKL domain-containing protein [Saccharofermentans sp.]
MPKLLLKTILYVIVVAKPCFAALLSVYFVREVLRYKIRNAKLAYVIAVAYGVIATAVFSVISMSVTGTVFYEEFVFSTLTFILMLFVAFKMEGKIWRRIIVVGLSTGIVFDINNVFIALSSELNLIEFHDSGNVTLMAIRVALVEVITYVLEFLLFKAIADMRKKKDDVPLPVPVLTGFWFILSLFVGVLPSEEHDTIDPTFITLMLLGIGFMFLLFYIRAVRKEKEDLVILNRQNEEYLESQTRFFLSQAKADSEIRSIRHDMRNHLQVISVLLQNNETTKIEEYLEQIGEDLSKTDISAHTGNLIADAIIADKKSKASEAGGQLVVSGTISGIDFAPSDMCKILANILDNAIEAISDPRLKDVSEDYKKIELTFKRTDSFFLISLRNPCVDELKITNGDIETTKQDKSEHGFGLKNVRTAVSNYAGELTLACDKTSGGYSFRTEILFPVS